jgi:hypothetical protein
VSKDTFKISQEYKPMKMKDLSTTFNFNLMNNVDVVERFLPNGLAHGWFRKDKGNRLDLYCYGQRKFASLTEHVYWYHDSKIRNHMYDFIKMENSWRVVKTGNPMIICLSHVERHFSVQIISCSCGFFHKFSFFKDPTVSQIFMCRMCPNTKKTINFTQIFQMD